MLFLSIACNDSVCAVYFMSHYTVSCTVLSLLLLIVVKYQSLIENILLFVCKNQNNNVSL